jgi:hypothetical protein
MVSGVLELVHEKGLADRSQFVEPLPVNSSTFSALKAQWFNAYEVGEGVETGPKRGNPAENQQC